MGDQLTPDEFVQAANAVELRNFAFPLRFSARSDFWKGVVLKAVMTVPERETGAARTIITSEGLSESMVARLTLETALLRLRQFLHNAVTHELDEVFYYQGARTFNPHARRDDLAQTLAQRAADDLRKNVDARVAMIIERGL